MSIRKTNPTGVASPPSSPSKRDSKRARVVFISDDDGDSNNKNKNKNTNEEDDYNGNNPIRQFSPPRMPGLTESSSGSNDEPPPSQLDQDDEFTGLESSLPQLTDYEAINREEDNGFRRSSIYVDAFNLALDTVLEEEAYLFDEQEHEVFGKYRGLDYEAQYLYVRLFLRKTNAWFRVGKLGYFYDIKNMPTACAALQSQDISFAQNESEITTIDEAASMLTVEELKTITKEAKVAGGNKTQLIAALRRSCANQGSLNIQGQLRIIHNSNNGSNNNSTTGQSRYGTIRTKAVIDKMLGITGPCIRLVESVTTLFSRVHLVFYRSTEWTEKSLTTLILARIMKRNFPSYFVCRTSNIFPTREALIDFERAIKLQSEVDNILENGVPTKDDLLKIVEIMESIYGRWERYCEDGKNKDDFEEIYLRRFSAGWVYTRIVHKGVYAISRHKDYERERMILLALLSQRLYHPSRRGAWYQRLALIEEHYFHDASSANSKRLWLRTALNTCEKGLEDPDTHVIYHYDLQKRITKLEKKLNIPMRLQHIWVWTLKKPTTRSISGQRIQNDDGSPPKPGQKTVWKLESGEEGSVEEMCLERYRSEGWKGFHCEGGIIKTIFAYLMYDILFLPLPNIFQTEFQTCPLDLHTDSFYVCRMSEINHRLMEISNGEGARIVKEVWKKEVERQTCVIGLDWKFEINEICEVVECLGGETLSVICKVLCQEYQQRSSGMPDLFLWDYDKKKAKFAEVKSENDRLSDTQRVWIDVLTGAGVETELCHAVNGVKG
ncbi:hypothetical protein TWF225_006735 [Orbilia oligospora]|uniref:Fanconi-associated nuclease n=1 Tax=Orbilia oligospora TaxID=2813651 RepID=A0A7C8P0C0_ORBOL|nr:hypothetical protein TWF751_010632 [Orbilia oligospora]KAF3181182.1 hypothetical protein TWF225_006735 [Orbilia oligospora]KAF3245367.1 hypothetical protein TWF217_010502 [Orbilia oligospora]KAF3270214.1 hypothetical protein TWF128_004029 [Orbilia oligospora]KAF3279948.1 hypothetical protein TWF132_011969 [Orbilia oligospora]